MKRFPISLQTNVFSQERHAADLGGVLAEIASAGYDGIEIGAHRIDLDDPDGFAGRLAAHGLVLAGLHTHAALHDPAAFDAAFPVLARAAAFAQRAGGACVLVSGKRAPGKSEADLEAEVESLERFGRACADHGVRLCHHNHDWEIEHDLRELRYLAAHTRADLVSFALDIGWVHRAGRSPADVTRELAGRAHYFHLKDTTAAGFTELGRGDVDVRGWLAAAAELPDALFTVERDEVLPDAKTSARISWEYLARAGV